MAFSHVLIEDELAHYLNLGHEHYSTMAVLITHSDALYLAEACKLALRNSRIETGLHSSCNGYDPTIVNSGMAGIGFLLHNFIKEDGIIDDNTDGPVKETPLYNDIMRIGSNNRFNWSHGHAAIARYYNDLVHGPMPRPTMPEPAPQVDETPIEMTDISTQFRGLGYTCKKIKMECGKYLIFTYGCKVDPLAFNVISKDKHIIVMESAAHYVSIMKKINHDKSKFTFIVMSGSGANEFSALNSMSFKNSLCLGYYVNESYIPVTPVSSKSAYSEYDSVMKDSATNFLFALRKGNVVYICARLTDAGKSDYQPYHERLLTEISRRMENKLSYEEIEKIDFDYFKASSQQNRDGYIKFASEANNIYIKKIKQAMTDGINDIGNLQRELAEKMKVYNQYRNILDNYNEEEQNTKAKQKATEDFDMVSAMPQIRSVCIKDDKVNIYTNEINAQDDRTKKWHNIGTFHIQLNMLKPEFDTQNSVVIKNTKHTVQGYNGIMEAPHVFNGGHICYGNLVSTVTECYANRDLYGLISALIFFLESANTNDVAGQNVSKWPEIIPESVKQKTEAEEDLSKYLI